MGKPRFSVWTVAAAYVGTVVGAGFASGQELLKFFTHHGEWGVAGLAAAAVLFAWLGAATLELGQRVGARSHEDVLRALGGAVVGRLIDLTATVFLFGTFAVMLAGSAAVFHEHLALPSVWGAAVMAVVTAATVLLGTAGVVRSIALFVPLMIAGVFAVTVATLLERPALANAWRWREPALAASPRWWMAALLYVSYNLVLAIPTLAPIGAQLPSPGRARLAGLLGGAWLGLAAAFVNLGLLGGLPDAARFEVPMLHLAERYVPALAGPFTLVLWLEVYTTAVACLYGLTARVTGLGAPRSRAFVLAATAAAWLLSQLGFSRMVGTLYPAVGYAGLLLIFLLARAALRRGR